MSGSKSAKCWNFCARSLSNLRRSFLSICDTPAPINRDSTVYSISPANSYIATTLYPASKLYTLTRTTLAGHHATPRGP